MRFGLVLILILLEDTLWDKPVSGYILNEEGLNPYSTGRYSVSEQKVVKTMKSQKS